MYNLYFHGERCTHARASIKTSIPATTPENPMLKAGDKRPPPITAFGSPVSSLPNVVDGAAHVSAESRPSDSVPLPDHSLASYVLLSSTIRCARQCHCCSSRGPPRPEEIHLLPRRSNPSFPFAA